MTKDQSLFAVRILAVYFLANSVVGVINFALTFGYAVLSTWSDVGALSWPPYAYFSGVVSYALGHLAVGLILLLRASRIAALLSRRLSAE